MFIKKFHAGSMELALAQVKEELGPNALILSSQSRPGKFLSKPSVEVIAAFEKEITEEAPSHSSADLDKIFPHRKKYRDEKGELPVRVKNPYQEKKSLPENPEEGWERQLKNVGLSDRSFDDLSRRLPFEFDKNELRDASNFTKAAARLSADSLRTLTFDGFAQKKKWSVVGAPGSGKTSLAVKLAMSCKDKKRECVLTSLDTRKITGRRELAGYAKLIGVPFSSTEEGSLETICIADTSYSEEQGDLNGSLLLVLPTEMRFQEAKSWLSRAQKLGKVEAVAFTRIDLSSQLGMILDFLKFSRLPCLGWTASCSFKIPFFWAEPLELSRLIFKRSAA